MNRLVTTTRLFLSLTLFLTWGESAHVLAQEPTPNREKVAVKFDEYGLIGGCDHSARLDNFTIQVQNEPTSEGYIIAYGPEGEGKGTASRAAQVTLYYIEDYLLNSRGLSKNRLKTIYGGRNSVLTEPRIELWIVPHGAPPPQPQKHETNNETFKGLFSDHAAWDDVVTFGFGEGTGPPVASVIDAAFSDMLRQQKTSVAYIVGYNGDDATPGAWRRVVERKVEILKEHALESSRLKTIYGGNVKETKIQLWTLPPGEPPPVKDAGPEPLPLKAIQIRAFVDYELGYAETEREAFSRLVEVLSAHPTLQAYLIVRLDTRTPEAETDEELETQPVNNEAPDSNQPYEPDPAPEPADLTKLAEKWKTELAGTNKIREDRLMVLYAPVREGEEGNTLEAWVVPPGQPLPDPNAPIYNEPENPAAPAPNSQKPAHNLSTAQSDIPPARIQKPPWESAHSEVATKSSQIPLVAGKRP